MTMALRDDSEGKRTTPKMRWLPLLEQVLKLRIGWVDEAVSPFARRRREDKTKPSIRQAA